ncbi:MAG: hypothetical protein R3300_12165, partial [Candidatus Promineifilaceae bacterium]|nr:hypothetical protein [Candidatus Promineifilaceae bacterium]
METKFDTAAIRELLNDAFTAEEVMAFCYDHFRDAYDQLVPGMGKLVKVHYLIEHCDRHGRLAELLQLVAQYNPHQYQRYEQRLKEGAVSASDSRRRTRRGLVTLLTAMRPPSGGLEDQQRTMVQLAFQVILAQILQAPLAQVEVAQASEGGAALQTLLPLEAIAKLMTMDGQYLAEELGILEVQITTTFQQEHG